jgi:multiple sugar transport system substrate-binding protein
LTGGDVVDVHAKPKTQRWKLGREPALFVLGTLAGGLVMALVAFLIVPLFDSPDGLEDGELVILSGKDQSGGKQRQELVDQWNRLYPRNPARIEELSVGADEQHSEMVARAQSDSSKFDILNLDVIWTAEFADAGYLAPLGEDTTDTGGFLSEPLATCRYDGRLWALPFNSDAGLMFYRDSVDKAPSTWDDIVQETRRVLAKPPDPQLVAGYTAQLDDYEGLVVNVFEAIWAAHGEVVGQDGTVLINSVEARTGLQRLAEGLSASDPHVILPDAKSQDETKSMLAFGEGKVLFMRNWPVAYRNLQELESDDGTQVSFKVATLPGPSVLGGQNLAVSSKSSRPHAAKALIEFLTSPRSQQILFERGGFAATREIVYLDAEVQKEYPYATELLKAIQNARSRPVTPHYVRFAETFRAVAREALDDGGRLKSDATDRLTAALRGE